MSTKSVFPPKNPPFEKSQLASYLKCPYCAFITKFSDSLLRHKSRFHQAELASEGDKSPREGGTKDYGLSYWLCNRCGYRVGPASLSDRYRPCQKWQDMMQTGNKCEGVLNEAKAS